MDLPEKPRWLDDHEELQSLLHRFLDKLDKSPASERKQPPAEPINPKTLPALFYQGEAADQIWNLIKSLADDFGMFEIRLDRKRNAYDPEYSGARLRFNTEREELLRRWLQRPRGLTSLQQWQQLVDEAAPCFPGSVERLRARIPAGSVLELKALLSGFIDIAQYEAARLSLRQISARCFGGLSKFLDHKEELVQSLYPNLRWVERAILVHVYLPKDFQQILFVENLDNYTQLLEQGADQGPALVYSSGFKGSAHRIREAKGVSLHYHQHSVITEANRFEQWWFDKQSEDDNLSAVFWGDLDYAGMAILKSLKQRFSGIVAWRTGYDLLLRILCDGGGHLPESARKELQLDPVCTGCNYADEVILPALREHGRFVDQEMAD